LLDWYAAHGRDLPWRRTRDPYRVLVSEIMLQQTQVDRVIPKYRQFLRRYPTLGRLAGADARDVRRLWYPLGYNARPFRLHQIAREAVARYGGRLPDRAEDLRRLPGVGRYTAGAVLAFAYGRDVAVLDTNVRRVLGRVFLGSRGAARAGREGLLGPRRGARAARPGVRLQSGAHGLRRDVVRAAEAEVRAVPDEALLRELSPAGDLLRRACR
jgi:A/G-specific adenine glycosylase